MFVDPPNPPNPVLVDVPKPPVAGAGADPNKPPVAGAAGAPNNPVDGAGAV